MIVVYLYVTSCMSCFRLCMAVIRGHVIVCMVNSGDLYTHTHDVVVQSEQQTLFSRIPMVVHVHTCTAINISN